MAEGGGYKYRVICALDLEAPLGTDRAFGDLGWHRARTPDAAIEKACEASGLPEAATGECIAVAARQWNARRVMKRMVPVWEIHTDGAGGEGDEEKGDSDPPPPAGSDLAPGIDVLHACEWSGDGEVCGHLPSEHGTRGLGMCRISGCPCGGYQPKPEIAA